MANDRLGRSRSAHNTVGLGGLACIERIIAPMEEKSEPPRQLPPAWLNCPSPVWEFHLSRCTFTGVFKKMAALLAARAAGADSLRSLDILFSAFPSATEGCETAKVICNS
jgi:hypothetical protein